MRNKGIPIPEVSDEELMPRHPDGPVDLFKYYKEKELEKEESQDESQISKLKTEMGDMKVSDQRYGVDTGKMQGLEADKMKLLWEIETEKKQETEAKAKAKVDAATAKLVAVEQKKQEAAKAKADAAAKAKSVAHAAARAKEDAALIAQTKQKAEINFLGPVQQYKEQTLEKAEYKDEKAISTLKAEMGGMKVTDKGYMGEEKEMQNLETDKMKVLAPHCNRNHNSNLILPVQACSVSTLLTRTLTLDRV